MVGFVVRPSFAVRTAVILTAAIAMLLPSPARCDGCATGKSDCPHCIAAQANTPTSPVRPCCQRHAATTHTTAVAVNHCTQLRSVPCSCCARPADRAWVPSERQISTQEILFALPASQPLELDIARENFVAVAAIADLPPPVPHRVLHCSWII
jgi:hypothetical protein